jgi:biopolymer transport protein ExbD
MMFNYFTTKIRAFDVEMDNSSRADARARYGLLVDAVDDLRSAGVDQLGLLTEQKVSITR